MTARPNFRSGFTLIELLAVLAVIAILSAILIPAVQATRLKAQQAESASNMRQIGAAMRLYAANNNNRLPETAHTAVAGQSWIFTLEEYLEDCDAVRICPADPKGEDRLKAGGTSYVLNSFLFVPQMDPFGQSIGGPTNNLTAIRNPSRTIMAFTVSDSQSIGETGDHTHSELWSSWAAVTNDISPSRFGGGGSSRDLSGSTNYLYVDGHVAQHAAAEMKARIEAGDNFAEPR